MEDYQRENLEIHETADGVVYIKDATQIEVESVEEALAVIRTGVEKRATFETAMNPVSSRSHTIFSVTVASTEAHKKSAGAAAGAPGGDTVRGTLNLVDLAGSERLDKSQSKGQRLEEAKMISKSLSALANVVVALAEGAAHVPFRDSKLTRVLQNSLGGNSFTTLVATLLPNNEHYEECLATLQFATRCRFISNAPRVNYMDYNPEAQERRIRKLLAEVAELKGRLDAANAALDEARRNGGAGAAAGPDVRGRGLGGAGSAGREAYLEGVLENVNNEKKALQKKLDKKKEEFLAVQDKMRAVQEQHFAQVQALRQKILDMSNAVETGKQLMISQINMATKQHEDEVNRLAVHNQKLMEEQAALVAGLSQEGQARRGHNLAVEEALAAYKAQVEQDVNRTMTERARDHDREKAELKAYYEQLLAAKKRELEGDRTRLGRDLAELRKAHEKLSAENAQLSEEARRQAMLLSEIERGVYPVHERDGVRSVALPRGAVAGSTGSLSATTGREVVEGAGSRLGRGAIAAVTGMRASSAGASSATPRPPSATNAVTSLQRDSLQRDGQPPPQPPQAQPQPPRPTSRASAPTPTDQLHPVSLDGDRPLTKAELKQLVADQAREIESLRTLREAREVVEDERRRIEEQVLTDLAEHETVEYILQLEAERDHYYSLYKQEGQRARGARALAEAAQRQGMKIANVQAGNSTSRSSRPHTAAAVSMIQSTARSQIPVASRSTSAGDF